MPVSRRSLLKAAPMAALPYFPVSSAASLASVTLIGASTASAQVATASSGFWDQAATLVQSKFVAAAAPWMTGIGMAASILSFFEERKQSRYLRNIRSQLSAIQAHLQQIHAEIRVLNQRLDQIDHSLAFIRAQIKRLPAQIDADARRRDFTAALSEQRARWEQNPHGYRNGSGRATLLTTFYHAADNYIEPQQTARLLLICEYTLFLSRGSRSIGAACNGRLAEVLQGVEFQAQDTREMISTKMARLATYLSDRYVDQSVIPSVNEVEKPSDLVPLIPWHPDRTRQERYQHRICEFRYGRCGERVQHCRMEDRVRTVADSSFNAAKSNAQAAANELLVELDSDVYDHAGLVHATRLIRGFLASNDEFAAGLSALQTVEFDDSWGNEAHFDGLSPWEGADNSQYATPSSLNGSDGGREIEPRC